MGFVERVGGDMQQGQGEECEPALQDHKTHLCDR